MNDVKINCPKPVVLLIIDGFGIAPPSFGNIIATARMPAVNRFIKTYPSVVLEASGRAIGLSPDQPGNSEAGYLNLGAGRRVACFPKKISGLLPEVLTNFALKQLYIAETERYANITYFLNGDKERDAKLQDWVLVPSLPVGSYINNPEMSAKNVNKKIINSIMNDEYDFIATSYANVDALAHSGDLRALVKAIEIVDKSVGQVVETVLAKNGIVFISATHGHAENMVDAISQEIDQNHSINPVPFIMISNQWEGKTAGKIDVPNSDLSLVKPSGKLADVAPTILKLMGIKKPREMTGKSLI